MADISPDRSPEIGERMIVSYSYDPLQYRERYSSDVKIIVVPSMDQNF